MEIIKTSSNEQPKIGWYLHIQGTEDHQKIIEKYGLQGIFICNYHGNCLIYLDEIQDEMMKEGNAEDRLKVANDSIKSLNHLFSRAKVQEIPESNTIGFIGSDGAIQMYAFLKTTINVTCSVKMKIARENINGEIEEYEIAPSDPISQIPYLPFALATPARRRALRLMKSPGFRELYVVLEDAISELGESDGIIQAGYSKTTIKRFKQTANSEAAGDHRRHGEVYPSLPPINPMNLKEAIQMIANILDYWLRQPPNKD